MRGDFNGFRDDILRADVFEVVFLGEVLVEDEGFGDAEDAVEALLFFSGDADRVGSH